MGSMFVCGVVLERAGKFQVEREMPFVFRSLVPGLDTCKNKWIFRLTASSGRACRRLSRSLATAHQELFVAMILTSFELSGLQSTCHLYGC